AFTLVMKDGKKEAVGGKTKQKMTGVKDGVLEGELKDQDASIGLRWKLANLSDATRRELSLLSVEDNKAACGELKAKWIYLELLGCVVKPTPAKVVDLETRLGELHAEGAPADVVDGLQILLKKVRDKLDAAMKADADRVAEEKRKLEEKR